MPARTKSRAHLYFWGQKASSGSILEALMNAGFFDNIDHNLLINGFGYTMAPAEGPYYYLDGAVSLNSPATALEITFIDGPVRDFGGIFWPTDYDMTWAMRHLVLFSRCIRQIACLIFNTKMCRW